ncbi:hypothetical protein [Entomomonas asaccharolytica]|uniref:Uncharacterized protein n=1 Tax=Entomomonas asaccharolytica TaxID=2785331 RepID=A0A974NI56_9GAMM|nr:hypothetical protein [Entomomonas asaccharolytica]QQP87040.1 hypothetical protein JHT90_07295 [Entomomonas asaccharolytica]
MQKKVINYLLVPLVIVVAYGFLMQQAIEQGRFYHAQEDYLLEASLLAYNPVINLLEQERQDQTTIEKFSTLNYIQFYDLLIRSNNMPKTNLLGTVLGVVNDQIDTIPYTQKQQRLIAQQVIPCRLLNRKQKGLIPEGEQVLKNYQNNFADLLKLQLDEKQIVTIWSKLSCN